MNKADHYTGAAFSWLVVTLFGFSQLESPTSVDVLVLPVLGLLLALAGGTLADVIEPATSFNHRDFFHSIGFGLLVLLLAIFCFANLTPLTLLVLYGASGYLSHLLLDATTSKGLPL